MDRRLRSTVRLVAAALLVATTVGEAISCKKFGRASKAPPSLADVAAGAKCGDSRPCDPDEVQNARVDLPDVRYADPPVDAPIKIVIDASRVTIVGDAYPVATMPKDPELGLLALDKAEGRGDLYVTPLAQALVGARDSVDAGQWEARPEESIDPKHSAIVVADRKTTYRVFTEVLFTVGQSELSTIYVAVRSGGTVGLVKLSGHSGVRHVSFPVRKGAHLFDRMTMGGPSFGKLSVRLAKDGIHVVLDDSDLAAGCDRAGEGPAIKRAAGAPFDFAALAACAKKAHGSVKDADHDARIAADPDVPLSDFMAAVDAIHGTNDDPLYEIVFPAMISGTFP